MGIGLDDNEAVSNRNPSRGVQTQDGAWRERGLRVTLSRFKATRKNVLNQPLNFQMPPLDEFAWNQAAEHQDFQTLANGQFSRSAGRSLLTFELRTLVVDYQPRWAAWHRARPNAPHPQQVAQLLKHIVQLGTPIMFTARSGLWESPDLRLPVTLRSVQSSERAGEVDARYFDLSFVEWREQELDRKGKGKPTKVRLRHSLPATVVIHDNGTLSEAAESDGQPKKIPTRAKYGTLSDLATFYYGDPSAWRSIVRENGIEDFAPNRDLSELKKKGKKVRKLRIPDLADPKTGGIESPV